MRSSAKATELVTSAITDGPNAVYLQALDMGDEEALAVAGLLLGSQVGPAPDRLNALLKKYERTSLEAAILVGLIVHASEIPDAELVSAAFKAVQQPTATIKLSSAHVESLVDVIQDDTCTPQRRAIVLQWLQRCSPASALATSCTLLKENGFPLDEVETEALKILSDGKNEEERAQILELTERAIEAEDRESAMQTLGAAQPPSAEQLDDLLRIFKGFAANGWPFSGSCYPFMRELQPDLVLKIATDLSTSGHQPWIQSNFLPTAFTLTGPSLVATLSDPRWPVPALTLLAGAAWSQHSDNLFPQVLTKVRSSGNDQALEAIRSKILERCQQTAQSGDRAAKAMPRIGVRALLAEALMASLPPSDTRLVQALGLLEPRARLEEYGRAKWSQPARAALMAEIVANAATADLVGALELALQLSDKAAAAFVETAATSFQAGQSTAVVERLLDRAELLEVVCRRSSQIADQALELWREQHDLRVFRALENTSRSDDRLTVVPEAVREYSGKLGVAERRELLEALPMNDARANLLTGILQDRTQETPPKATDLRNALEILREHFHRGFFTDAAFEVLANICEEEHNTGVRRAAYAVLAEAQPIEKVVGLLVERHKSETPGVADSVREALSLLADKLEVAASQGSAQDRVSPTQLLARTDENRALPHIRELLMAPDAAVRGTAAELLGQHGEVPGDAARLGSLLTNEPSRAVREIAERSKRRLEVGDAAAAHERLGDLIEIEDRAYWSSLEPNKLYGNWVEALIEGLDRIARAESKREYGTAIDQLGEVAKILLYRAIKVAGPSNGLTSAYWKRVSENAENYGPVLSKQDLLQKWPWVSYLASLYQLRTEHLAVRGSQMPPSPASAPDLAMARNLFRLAGRDCCRVIAEAIAPTSP